MSEQLNGEQHRDTILNAIRHAGIVGCGGGGFPTHEKLRTKAEIVIANGVECEPLLESDRHMLLRNSEKVINGLRLAMKVVGAKQGYLAVKAKHKDIIILINAEIRMDMGIKLFLMENFYPAGDEHVLVYEITGRRVPMGGLPIHVGVVVCNVSTLAFIADAMKGMVLTHRYLTVTGDVHRPAVANVPLGISLQEAIDGVGKGASIKDFAIIVGGPMMGKVETDLSLPVTKTTTGIIVMPRHHHLTQMKTDKLETVIKRSRSACCQCRFCTDLCPRYLLGHNLQPHKLMQTLAYATDAEGPAGIESAALCSECGLCAYFSCPMGLVPNRVIGLIKGVMAKNKQRPDFKQPLYDLPPFRDYRKVPAPRLIARLGLQQYPHGLPFVELSPLPSQLALPLKQHVGVPAKPVVSVGDRVGTGSILAKCPEGELGANLHSPAEGIVTVIDDCIRLKIQSA